MRHLPHFACMLFASYCSLSGIIQSAFASDLSAGESETTEKSSPWLITPTLSSDPKLSTTVGGLVGYIHHFDEQSPASMFATTAGYSSSDSYYYGAFAKTYFNEDTHRISGGAFWGKIKNEYEDYLGTGLPAKTEDDITGFVVRYQRKVFAHLYLGVQAIASDYLINPGDALTGEIMERLGLTGFQSNGLGLVVDFDQRNDQNSPTQGSRIQAHNIAYRKSLGGDESFDVYTVSTQHYIQHNQKFVTAINAKGRWTADAPASAYSSVELRGYIRGQYLQPHMTMIEVEERINIYKKWGASVFTGVAALYGSENSSNSDDIYPAFGFGLNYEINDEKMVVRAEAAFGKDQNQGFYLSFGQPF